MSEKNSSIIEPKGFALLLKNILSPLEKKDSFAQLFCGTDKTFLINPINLNFAGLMILRNKTLTFKAIPNENKKNLKKRKVEWDAYLEMDSQTLLALIMKRLSYFKLVFKWIFGDIKLRGLRNLFTLKKIIDLLYE